MSNFSGYDLTDPIQKRQLLEQLLGDPTMYPDALKQWVPNWMGTQTPQFTIDQIPGFQQFTSEQSIASTSVTTSSTAYVQLAGGPSVTGLSNGTYTVSYGCTCFTSTAGIRAKINIGINGAPPNDAQTPQAYSWSTAAVGISAQATVTLTGGGENNNVTMYYGVGTGVATTGTFDMRYLTVTRIN